MVGFFDSIALHAAGGLANYPPDHDYWYTPRDGGVTPAGIPIDADGARKLSAWYRGREILCTTLAMLPLPVLERLPNDGGSTVARNHPLYFLLHDQPNEWQNSFEFRRLQMGHLIDYGNGLSVIRDGSRSHGYQSIDQLWPLHPTCVKMRQASTGRVLYEYRHPQTQQVTTYNQDEIFHLRGGSDDGFTGIGILKFARENLGLGLVIERYTATMFGKGPLGGGFLEAPGKVDPEVGKRMAERLIAKQGEWWIPKLLEQGVKWSKPELSPEDFQMILSRKTTVDDIARWLGVPRHMLENSDPSFGNAEQFNQNFIDYHLSPWLSLWEFAINTQLVLARGKYYAEFTRDALVRGDLATRTEANVKNVNAGIRSVDEIRRQENWNARGGKSDELREPQNITGKPAVPDEGGTKPPTPKKKTAPDDDSKAQAIAFSAASRALHLEITAVQKLAVKHADNQDDFAAAITEFYAAHAKRVSEMLLLSEVEASRYCAGQASRVLGDWLAVVEEMKTDDYARGLAAWALQEAA